MASRKLFGVVACVAAMFLMANMALAASQYNVTDLDTLGCVDSVGLAINNSGQVTGIVHVPGDSWWHAFLYSGGTMQDLGRPGTEDSVGIAINDSGVICGYYGGPWRALTWDSANGMRELSVPGGQPYTFAEGINNAGHIVAHSQGYSGAPDYAYILRDGSWSSIPAPFGYPVMTPWAINNRNRDHGQVQVVGQCRLGSGPSGGTNTTKAWVWDEVHGTQVLPTLGGTNADAYAINDNGQIVGDSQITGDITRHAFLYSDGVMHDLGTLGGNLSQALDLNASGQVVGYSYLDDNVTYRSFLYSDGVMHDLSDLIVPGSGWTNLWADAINDDGWITGNATNALGQTHAVLLTPVPEPATLSLLALGGIAVARKRIA
jgi:probable HAF family extracellular repeat protein